MATVRERLAQAAAEQGAGRPAAAAALCREILATDPAQADAWHLLGIARHALGEPGAADDLRHAIALQPDSAVFHHNLASLLAAHGELAAARAAYGEALQRAPNDPDSACALAEVCAATQDWPAAIAAWRQALAGDARCARAHLGIGLAQEASGASEAAAMSYAAAIASDPQCADAHVNLGAWQHARGRRERAAASYRAALAIDPVHAEAHANLATYYKESDRLDEAARHYAAALDAAPALPEAHKNLADILALQNDTAGARRHYEAALAAQPDYDEARYKLAALTGEALPAAPAAYVAALFDGYAGEYDSHMTATLGYGVPQRLHEAVAAHLPAAPIDLLDLGCGTGLSLAPFRENTRRAVGVDLSPRMLEQAQGRGYDRLIVGEIGAVLGDLDESFDLALAADVFVYLGDLAAVLAGCRRVLRPAGLVVFSVERGQPGEAGPGYRIGAGGRYAHSADYLSAVTGATGFELVVREETVLRREQGRDVAGFVVVLRRRP